MDPIRHQRVSELFAEAIGLDEAVRRAFLETRCGDDSGLVEEILSLLSHHQAPQAVVGTGILNIGALLDTAAQAVDPADSGPSMGSALASTGQYTILRVLGEGGMGTVYLAEQDRPRRTVALKVMRTTISGASRMRKRFELEAEVLGRLEHPGIARIYDAGVASVTTPEGSLNDLVGRWRKAARELGDSDKERTRLLEVKPEGATKADMLQARHAWGRAVDVLRRAMPMAKLSDEDTSTILASLTKAEERGKTRGGSGGEASEEEGGEDTEPTEGGEG